ncbi:hypothetical protein HPP92_008273 [Vanilla planifolia]|uniref:DUF547 domain-containing protein n=1 Tax=Vanilla planifolia TaxID=51239 RepID=A0A835R9D4_VANPL|nr:hypothetical protein HPP92_008273 [Vanilla planifolia]
MKPASVQQRKQELDQEVAKLQKMLCNEEKVHEILERALIPKGIPSVVNIPNFLPKKVKELLAELIIVEDEIARLEEKISNVQQSINIVQESRVQGIAKSREFEEKLALGTKPMFFINQAIKGDYSKSSFASIGNSLDSVSRIEKNKREVDQEKISRSGIIDLHPTTKIPPRHPNPTQSDSNMEVFHKLLHEPVLSASPTEKDGQNLQPNKLSEKILKCFICIFLRLMRTSRMSELEKSSLISRSSNTFSRTRSFRMFDSLNLNSGISINRDAGQKDPYGIFEIEDSLLRDIGPYKNLVRFTSSHLDLKGMSNCLPLLHNLRNLLDSLCEVDLKLLTHHQQLAFWINIHNSCVMHGFLEHGMPLNSENIPALRNRAIFNIGGHLLTATAIEHCILRQSSTTPEGDGDGKHDSIRSKYGLKKAEPNVTFALCCGNRSSPAIKIYTSEGVSVELEKSKLEYLQASLVVTGSRRIMIPELLALNMPSFAVDLDSLLEWVCNQLPSSWSLRKSIFECVRGQGNGRVSDIADILPYDFEFQYLLPM